MIIYALSPMVTLLFSEEKDSEGVFDVKNMDSVMCDMEANKSNACVQKRGAEALIEIAKGNSYQLGEKGAVALAGALRYVPSLSELSLKNNSTGDEGSAALERAIERHPKK